MEVKTYKDLIVWQKSMCLVDMVYDMFSLMPSEEKYSLCDQMRRSAVSIPSNIAEGWARATTKEYLNFLSIANGSYCELETQLQICKRNKLAPDEKVTEALSLADEVGKMLASMIRKLGSGRGDN